MFPVDWSHPLERAIYIARETDARLVVTGIERRGAFDQAGRAALGLEDEIGDIAACEPLFFEDNCRDHAEASGICDLYLRLDGASQGRDDPARNIVFQIDSEMQILGLTADDIVYASASLAFDMSIEEMWAAFRVGATLLVGYRKPGQIADRACGRVQCACGDGVVSGAVAAGGDR